MKHLKKYMAALWSLGLATIVPVTSHAFTSKQVLTETASASVTGGSSSMSISVLTVGTNATAGQIQWPSITAGTGWTEASQYIQIVSNLSVAGAGIQTYTNNSAAGAIPTYGGTASSTTAAGLVDTTATTQVLPLAWQIRAPGVATVAPDDPNCTGASGQPATCVAPFNGYAWFYYADAGGTPHLLANADAGNTYIEPIEQGNMIQFAQGPGGFGASGNTNNLYLEANFATSVGGGTTYQTSTLTLELFTN